MTTTQDTCATTHGRDAGVPAARPSLSASGDHLNHGATWARQWIKDELSKARITQNTEGLL